MNTDPKKTPRPKVTPYLKHIAVFISILLVFAALVLYTLPGFLGGNGFFGQNGSTSRTGLMGDNAASEDTGKGNGDTQELDSGSPKPQQTPGNGKITNPVQSQGTSQSKNAIPVPPQEDTIKQIGTPAQKKQQAKNETPQNVPGTGLGRDGRGFFGKKLDKKENIWFIVDLSGSMASPMSEGILRVDALKNQLLNAIKTMHKEGSTKKYCIQPFGTNIGMYPNTAPQKLAKFNKSTTEVENYINSLQAIGGTPMMNAWQTALHEIKNADVRIDAIYFLSDGEPTDCCPVNLLNFLKTNVPKNIKVYTFAIGQKSVLMETIAQQHGGVCITAL